MRSWKSSSQKNKLILLLGILGCIASAVLSICAGSSGISPSALFKALFSPEAPGAERAILLYIRLPRTAACLLAGAGLSVSGTILQRVLANKLASPGIIGVNAGAGLGVTLCCAFGAASGLLFSLSAFLGSLFAISVITIAAYRTRASKTTVILGGVAINAILNAISEAVSYLDTDAAVLSAEFRVGGFADVSYIKLAPAAFLIAAALVAVMSLSNELDVISLGDDTAQGLGMKVRRTKNIFLLLASLLAGASVSFSGLLGFIGLVVPHLVRKILGSESRQLLLGSCIFGAAFLTVSDVLARVLFAPYEIPVGIIMALAGGPVFVWLLIRRKGGHAND